MSKTKLKEGNREANLGTSKRMDMSPHYTLPGLVERILTTVKYTIGNLTKE